MIDYENKYIKYKNKYIKLKSQICGNVSINVLTWNVSWECMNGPNSKCSNCKVRPINNNSVNTICQDNLIKVFNNLTVQPDFIFLQEADTQLVTRIKTELNKRYALKYTSVVYQPTSPSKAIAVIIYRDNFKLLTRFSGDCDNDYKRPFLCGKFKEQKSNKIIYITSIHGPHVTSDRDYVDIARVGNKPIIKQILDKAQLNSENFNNTPFIIAGDFNTNFNSPLGYSFSNLSCVNTTIDTCCSFPNNNNRTSKPDNILYNHAKVTLNSFGTFNNIQGKKNYMLPNNNLNQTYPFDKYTSDHLPIATNFIL